MAIPDGGSNAAVKRKALDGAVEFVQLLRKVERSNEHLVPLASFMWQSGKTLRSDPFEKVDVRDIRDSMVNTGAQFQLASLLQGTG